MSGAGNPFLSTPNLDRLAREGAMFRRATTPCPVCVPARTSFLTGLSIHTTGYTDNRKVSDGSLNVGAGSFDQQLVRLGYRAEHHGRWHAATQLLGCYSNDVSLDFIGPYREWIQKDLGEPPPPADGQYVDYLSGWPYTPDVIDSQLRADQGNPPGHGVLGVAYGISSLPEGCSHSAVVASQVLDALDRLKDGPFSLTAALLHPHHPQYVSRKFAGTIDPAKIEIPATLDDRRENTPYSEYPWQVDATDKQHIQLIRARYYEMVQEVDQEVGRILDKLDALGLAERTMVVLTADHGEMLGDHGLTQKFVPFEESIRVPMLIRLPARIPPGTTVDHAVSTVDLLATICDYLDAPIPKQEGQSLRPVIENRGGSRSPYTFSEYLWKWEKYSLLTSNEWKFVWTADPEQVDLLYNLEADPQEQTNLIGRNPNRSRHLPKAEEIRRDLLSWMEGIGHPDLESLHGAELS